MRRMIGFVAAMLLPTSFALAQSPSSYPVTLGLGGGMIGNYDVHALAVVGITPANWPVGLRLDGMWTESNGLWNRDLLSAVSASAVVTLRPWRVAPYLIVGATRSSDYVIPPIGSYQPYYIPARTDLTGGLGITTQWRKTKLFLEMRHMGRTGNPLTFGLTF